MVNDATRTRLIEATVRLLSEQGPSGSGTARILQEAGAQRGSLYFSFPAGKDELVGAAVEGSGAQTTATIRRVFDAETDLATRMERYFEVVGLGLLEEDYRYGCAVGATALDLAASSATMRDATSRVFRSWADAVAGYLRDGGIAPVAATTLAISFVAGIEGATMLARAMRSTEPLSASGKTLAAAVRQAQQNTAAGAE